MPNARMKRILEIADFVKFAKVRPLTDDNHRALAEAVRFVEETKPVEEPTGEGGEDSAPDPVWTQPYAQSQERSGTTVK